MKFDLSIFLLAVPLSLVHGESDISLRGAERNLIAIARAEYLESHGEYNNTLGKCIGSTCGVWGDPHFVTCDGYGYDCQGIGLFTIMKNHMYNIQGRFLDISDFEKEWRKGSGASMTNDIMIDFLQPGPNDSSYPTLQLGFGDISDHDGTFLSEAGCNNRMWVDPKLKHEGRKLHKNVKTVQDCKKKCLQQADCIKFQWWTNKRCYTHKFDDEETPQPRNLDRSVTGTRDGTCGDPITIPPLSDEAEENFHGEIGRRCPLVMHVNGTLQDISEYNYSGKTNGFLYNGKNDDFSVKMENNKIIVSYKLQSGDYAQVELQAAGKGPGELWSCHWNTYICLPASEQDEFEKGGLGLLGTPDGNRTNDFMTPEGVMVPISGEPFGPKRNKAAHEYCYDNWCVSQKDSLMTYSGKQTYNDVKCEKEDFIDFNIHENCANNPFECIAVCKAHHSHYRYGCQIDCCNGDDENMDVNTTVVTLDDKNDDPDPNEPNDDYCTKAADNVSVDEFINVGTDKYECPDESESLVQLLHSKGTLAFPDDETIIYGLNLNFEPHDDVEGLSIKFRVNNFLENPANIYIKHTKSVLDGNFMDPTCDSMLGTESGCVPEAPEIEVACHQYEGQTPFALVNVYFQSNDIGVSDTSVDSCCAPDEKGGWGVVMYAFKILCECATPTIA